MSDGDGAPPRSSDEVIEQDAWGAFFEEANVAADHNQLSMEIINNFENEMSVDNK